VVVSCRRGSVHACLWISVCGLRSCDWSPRKLAAPLAGGPGSLVFGPLPLLGASFETGLQPGIVLYDTDTHHAWALLARVGACVNTRPTNVLARWFLLRWFQDETESGCDGPSERWKSLAQLAIKHVHADIAGLAGQQRVEDALR